MQIWQIVGPSFSGSTLLGNVLNAHDGHFFGSEVYRLLPSAPSAGKAGCSSCGQRCPYWTDDLRGKINGIRPPRLANVYREFERAHPKTVTFIDGSKSLTTYQNDWREYQLITTKHPLRMVSSGLYNRCDLLGLPFNTPFKEFHAATRGEHARFADRSNEILEMVLHVYSHILDATPRQVMVKTDTLQDEDFAEYKSLCNTLGIDADKSAVTNFTSEAIHPIGGNKALVWQRREREGKESMSTQIDRAKYYVHSSQTDYRVDDKYKELIAPELRDHIHSQSTYLELCAILGYSPQLS